MPNNNNNLIPKENHKKVEEIREIKTELPTYEEFINKKTDLSPAAKKKIINKSGGNYQSPLVDKDISEIKGYGPCRVCYKDTQWTDLYMPCAASGCSNKTPAYWYHTPGCGSRLEVSNKAKIRCSGCSFNCDLKDYPFACSRHWGDYRTVNRDSIDKSLSIVLGGISVDRVMTDLVIYTSNHN